VFNVLDEKLQQIWGQADYRQGKKDPKHGTPQQVIGQGCQLPPLWEKAFGQSDRGLRARQCGQRHESLQQAPLANHGENVYWFLCGQ
jgi:hypothetical protein